MADMKIQRAMLGFLGGKRERKKEKKKEDVGYASKV